MSTLDRRSFLRNSAAVMAGAGATASLGQFAAHAATTGGYRALVCVFLRGGADCYDMLLPYDQQSFNTMREARRGLLDTYNQRQPAGMRRRRTDLLPLDPLNAADYGARAFALPPQLSRLHGLFQAGKASVVANAGPLLTQINRTQYESDMSVRPTRLFSHNDQQSNWMAFSAEGTTVGWGGRFADSALNGAAPESAVFNTIAVDSDGVFLWGDQVSPYQVSKGGALEIDSLKDDSFWREAVAGGSQSAHQLLEEHLRGASASSTRLFASDATRAVDRAIDHNRLFNASLSAAAGLTGGFPDSDLGAKLAIVAKSIAARGALNVSRQIFFVTLDGFDTHNDQSVGLPNLQVQLDRAIGAFYDTMVSLGLENSVTLFTGTEFGRALVSNGDGTDHGWGGHGFVVGGGVNGRRIFGDVPSFELGNALDSGNGRLIPTTSVQQVAAPLGRWFGLNDQELAAALPGLAAFDAPPDII